MDALRLEPLPPRALPASVATLVAATASARLMAARGMAPLRPAELLLAIYQLSFDADAAVRSAALATAGTLPDKVVLAPLGELLPASVLHFFAGRLPSSRRPAIEKILLNQATADQTFVELARRLDEGGLEIIFQNEVRLLRCPALVETLYLNTNARMSSVSRALELCARHQVRLDLPGYDEMAALLLADPNAATPSLADEAFATVLREEEHAPAQAGAPVDLGGEEGLDGLDEDLVEEGGGAGKAETVGASFIKFDALKIFEKIRLATVGNQYCRQVLIRDTNKVVAMAVVRSPSITDLEIVAAASNRAVCEDVIRYIANSRVHSKDYAVKQALINNPKCPLGIALRLLAFLHPEDLKAVSRSKNIPGALATAAKKLLQTRGQSRGSS
jgi:hypothetical protein